MPLTELRHAARRLAGRLARFRSLDPIIVAVPRRGVVVGLEVSRALAAPLEVVLASKVFPGRRSSAPVGAVALGGVLVADMEAAAAQGMSADDLDAAFEAAERRLGERLPAITSNAALSELRDRVVILVDDAAVTGLTMQVAIGAVALRRPARIIAATPLCSESAAARLGTRAAELISLAQRSDADALARHEAAAVALCPPLSDEDVHAMLRDARWPERAPLAGALELDGLTDLDR